MLRKMEKVAYVGLHLLGGLVFVINLFLTPFLGMEWLLSLLGVFVVDIFYDLYKIRSENK